MPNLALSCLPCNRRKSQATHAVDPSSQVLALVPLFNPRRDVWRVHFDVADAADGLRIVGRTAIGRATVERLGNNDAHVVQARSFWVLLDLFPP